MPRKITVIEKKLGREKADGVAFIEEGLTFIDPRLRARPRHMLKIEIHESLHHCDPAMQESKVKRLSAGIAADLWKRGYRLTAQ